MINISFVIPVFNTGGYLDECISSIMEIKDVGVEIVAVDDCSTDNSYEVLCRLKKEYEEINIVRNTQNRGVSYSRNIGIDNSHGRYISFVDSDDMIMPQVFRSMLKILTQSDANCIMGDLLNLNLNNDLLQSTPIIHRYTSEHVFTPNHVVGGGIF